MSHMNEPLNDNFGQKVARDSASSTPSHVSGNGPTVDSAKEPRKSGFWTEIFKFTLITLIIVVPFRLYVAQPFIVSGASMDPTFADGEYLIVDQLTEKFEQPKRESVIIFRYPKDTTKFFIKRVIGLPGEKVQINNGQVTIYNKENPNGLTLKEPYISDKDKKFDNMPLTLLGENEFFVLGDNRLGSLDSRAWGTVPEKLIVGRPLVRLLPINRLSVLPGDYSGSNTKE